MRFAGSSRRRAGRAAWRRWRPATPWRGSRVPVRRRRRRRRRAPAGRRLVRPAHRWRGAVPRAGRRGKEPGEDPGQEGAHQQAGHRRAGRYSDGVAVHDRGSRRRGDGAGCRQWCFRLNGAGLLRRLTARILGSLNEFVVGHAAPCEQLRVSTCGRDARKRS